MAELDVMPRLDKAHQSVLHATPPDFLDLSDIPKMRQKFIDTMAKIARPPRPEGLEVTDHRPSDDVMVRTYRPAGLETPAAALYWIHGGGLVMGTVDLDDDYCAGLAHRLGILVASVEYRLSPDFPYPVPLEDCYTGLRWLHDNATTLGVDPARIGIGGASGGGALCAGLGLLARDRAQVPVCYQFLVFPMIDDRNETPMSQAILDPRLWNRTANLIGWNSYLEGRAGAPDIPIYAAAARATVEELAGLPPTYINVGDLDLFVDEDVISRPFGAVDVPMPVNKRLADGIHHSVVPSSKNVPDLVRNGIGDRRARVMHHEECVFRVAGDTSGQAATVRAVQDETDDVGALFVAQLLYVCEWPLAVDHLIEVLEQFALIVIVDFFAVHEPQFDVAETTVPECLVGLLDPERQQFAGSPM